MFVHLHTHGEDSTLDGMGPLEGYAGRAAQLGQPALALTDHGTTAGFRRHYDACTGVGIKPILGCEFYVAPEDYEIKTRRAWGPGDAHRVAEDGDRPELGGNGAYTHLTVLAADAEGVRNLYRLQSEAWDRGYYYKPRIDLTRLAAHHSGLIVLSGCAGSAISTRLRLGQLQGAESLVEFFKSTFKESFFIEVMHHGIPFEDALNRDLIGLATRHSVPLVATNDSHYCSPEDAPAHAAMLCVGSQSTLAKPAFAFSGSGYHIASRQEMERKPLPVDALDNTLYVTEMVGSYDAVFARNVRWPTVRLPDGWDDTDALWELAAEGLSRRVPGAPDAYWSQLRYEHDVICRMGYPAYFLALHEILREGRKRGIVIGPGRGSAGGSVVAYALGITDLDPIEHRLIFERFLNPQRVSLPDVDIDVNDTQRDQLIGIARELFGDAYVAHIGTTGTFGAKAALKDAVRVTGGSVAEGEYRASQLPPAKFGRAPHIRDYTGPRDEVYQIAEKLFRKTRSLGAHAAGVVISQDDLREIVPLRRLRDDNRFPDKNYPWVTSFVDDEIEALGLIKMDFLGLRNLGIIDECLRMLLSRSGDLESGEHGRSRPFELPTMPSDCNDPRTYELLARGDTLGVFQLDSPGMRGLLRKLKPNRFDDVSAVLALYRPGPMGANAHVEYAARKNGGVEWRGEWAIHPELEEALKPVLAESYGLIVWQEQVLETLKVVCGWSYAEAALLFDAMRKKNHAKMEATRPAYEDAGIRKGYSKEALSQLWATLVPFADYSFNRAHSAGYGLVAYWTGYLKANHPVEYMAAVLSSVAEDKDRLPEYLAEVERMGIRLLPPDINASGVGFSPGGGGIHYGMSAIKGVGVEAYKAIASKRPYKSLDDFFLRCPVKALNSGTLAALVGSGALDSLCSLREELYVARDSLSTRAQAHRREARAGQRPLYRVAYGVGPSGLYSVAQRQQWERQYLSAVLTQESVTLVPRRRLTADEVTWLRSIVTATPGRVSLSVRVGGTTITLPQTDWPVVEPAVSSLGVFDVHHS